MTKFACLILTILMASSQVIAEIDDTPSFKNEFSGSFLIGAAVSEPQFMGRELLTRSVVRHQFNALTAENDMKWEELQPNEGEFQWSPADTLVEFCEDNEIFLTGHTLIWHHQTPDWVFEDKDGAPASREMLLARMESHIKTVVERFKGRVPSWDVVNEALNDDGSMRETKWSRLIGADYVLKAFEFAHKADPQAELYYNDYSLYLPAKRAAAVKLVKQLQASGIPVAGIGMQGHYGLDHPEDLSQIGDSIEAFAELGKVMITELDMTVLPFPDSDDAGADLNIDLEMNEKYNPYTSGLPAEIEQAQTERYLDIFKEFLEHRDKLSRVTFWGVNNAQSWRNGWPMRGRTDYPLMFDRGNELRPMAYELFKLVQDTE